MKMNASQAEKAYGVPRMTAGRWIKTGRLRVDAEGYFEESDFLDLNSKRLLKPAPGRKTGLIVKKKTGSKKKYVPKKKALPEQRDTSKALHPLASEQANTRQGVDLRKALANARKAEMDVKIKMKDLISRELVSRVFRGIYAIDSTEWRGLGARLAPDIMALCEIEDPKKEAAVGNALEREVFGTLNHVKQVINVFLEEIESEDRIDDD